MKLILRKVAILGFFLAFQSSFAQSLVIEPSRTSGTAPLYVFFDATSSTGLDNPNDLPNADISWDFDVTNVDPSGNWELTKGMVAGHVFEEPGTYTVSCTMIARNGTVDTKEITITVSAFSGTTYYVSNEEGASDENDGLSETTPWATANHALSQLGTDTRILFRRGDMFEGINEPIRNLNEGAKRLGAYGSGDDPILRNELDRTIISVNNCSDVAVQDLRLWVNDHTDGTSNAGNRGLRAEGSTHILGLRLEIDDAASFATYQDDGDLLGIFDCDIHDIGTIGIFSRDSRRLSWVGNTIDGMETTQPEHGMRIQGGEKQYIAHNIFQNLIDVKTSLTVRGDNQRHVMIYKNKMDRIVQFAPTDATLLQFLRQATIEANYIGQNPEYESSNFAPSISAVNIIATEVVVRNNVFDGLRRGVTVAVEHPEIIPSDVDIYNNTMHWRAVNESSGSSGRLVRVDGSQNVTVRNNLMSAANQNEMQLTGGEGNTNLIESDNLMTVSPGYASVLGDSPAHLNNASNYRILDSSPGVNQGALDVPVYFDQTGGKRYYGTAPDLGAFEYDDGGDVTNPDPSEGREVVLVNSIIPEIMVFPNPVSDVLRINGLADQRYEIYSSSGSVNLNGVASGMLDISSLKPGMYFIKIGTEVFKFIKK